MKVGLKFAEIVRELNKLDDGAGFESIEAIVDGHVRYQWFERFVTANMPQY